MLLGFSEVMAMDAKFVDAHKLKTRAPSRPVSPDLVTAFTDMRGDIADWRVPSDGKYRAGDLIAWAKEKGFVADEVLSAWAAYQAETKKTQTKTAFNDGPDFKMLATRAQLITAFGAFTGMDATWFENLTDTPKLMNARKVIGKGAAKERQYNLIRHGECWKHTFQLFTTHALLVTPARALIDRGISGH
jgi:hypothetical protein